MKKYQSIEAKRERIAELESLISGTEKGIRALEDYITRCDLAIAEGEEWDTEDTRRLLVKTYQAREEYRNERYTLIEELHDTATEAARALCTAYEEATNSPADYLAAYRVAREDIRGTRPATEEQRAAVAAMVQAIAEAAELKDVYAYADMANTYAESAAWAERKAEEATTAESAAARAHQARVFATFTGEAADKARASLDYSTRVYYADYETNAYSAEAVRIRREDAADAQTAADRAEQAAQRAEAIAEQAETDHEPEPAPVYQRAELEAFLGDYADDYDVDAIEAEATEYDPRTGRTVWTPESVRDLMSICERHELKA